MRRELEGDRFQLTANVLGISGSLRRGSYNRRLLRAAQGLVPAGHELRIFSGLETCPPFSEDTERKFEPSSVKRLRSSISRSQWLIISTPEYNGSVPGFLKNALDWASRPFPENCLRGMPTLVVSASSGYFGAAWAQADLKRILNVAGARVVDHHIAPIRAEFAFDSHGRLVSEAAIADLSDAITALLAEAPSLTRSGRRP